LAPFHRRDGQLYCENVALLDLAQRFGTPLYVYSSQAILSAYASYRNAMGARAAQVCYAVKANPNLGVLGLLARAGSGFDIVSGGELARVIAAGGSPSRTVFSGVGKTTAEMESALKAGILCFNVESEFELQSLSAIAARVGIAAPVSVRVNPDIDPGTHPYIATGLKSSKFGVDSGQALELYRRAAGDRNLRVTGIDCHIGSQITHAGPIEEASDRVLDLVDRLAGEGIRLHHLDFGGGLGIAYRPQDQEDGPPPVQAWVDTILRRVDARGHGDKTVLLEPGRSIVGAAGVLLTRVIGLTSSRLHPGRLHRPLRPTTSSVRSAKAATGWPASAVSPSRPAMYWRCSAQAPTG
jgi:diaminopimelate decarboxylase